MRPTEVIMKKRLGQELTREEIACFVKGATDGSFADYQLSAMLMAICLQGMTDRETVDLTMEMARSGDMLDLSAIPGVKADKHSTGGVGDTTTLIVAPLTAACGLKVAKMSGRGLGYTGGTLDKLESIPGVRVDLTEEQFIRQVTDIGLAVIGQTADLAPADKTLYALRDVTATVDSLPLITSSIMSKKLAAGSHSIVLDVKVGSGAFMKTLDAGRELAEHMVTIGKACGRNVTAVLTNMDVPLGHRIGNALKVEEAVEILRGEGCPDLQEVCTVLASNMLMLCNGWDEETARAQVKDASASGRAFEQMKRWVAAQGGDPAVLDDTSKLPQAAIQHEILAPCGGYLAHMDAQKIGEASALLGAGRQTKEDVIDFAAGVVLKKKTGERVEAGEVLAVLHANRAESVPAAEAAFLGALQWSDTAPEKQPLILGIVR